VLYLARHEGRAPMRLSASIGSRFPAAPTAVGNALLTTLTDSEIAARFTGPQHFPRRTDHSVQTLDGLLRKIRLARTRGYAIDDNEVHPGVYGVAVVLPPWASGDQALALGASLMAVQASDQFVASIVEELVLAVDRLSNPLLRRPIAG
jgi:IclR family transcriptional regulator, blcABC operon repressor